MTKAIILTAGQGQRLRPLTNDRPKGMVAIDGSSIIERQATLFKKVGIDSISLVKGFCPESIPPYAGIRQYLNPEYAVTNMVYSLFAAEEELNSDTVIVSYGDILYSEKVLRQLLASRGSVSVAVDSEWKSYFAKRFDDPYEDAESLVFDQTGGIKRLGETKPAPSDIQAQYIGLIKFDERGLAAIRTIRDAVATKETPIGWGRPWRKAFMTDLLQELINRGEQVEPVTIAGGWCEIDSLRDFEIAPPIINSFSA